MSDLRDRIAAALIAHPDQLTGECCGGQGFTHVDQWAQHVADAVIAELGLRMEWAVERSVNTGRELLGDCPVCDHEATHDEKSVADYYRNILPVEQKAALAHRYVTDWKARR